MQQPPLVITIQSQVVTGHVGNSAAVFPLQAAGFEVAPVPTVLLSNTPFYPTLRGGPLPVALFSDLLTGAQERALPERAAFIMTGYIGSAEIAHRTAQFIARAKTLNPNLIYLCDPVIGDTHPGLYVPLDVVAAVRDRLLPLADIVTPNQFEAEYFSGMQMNGGSALPLAAKRMGLGAKATLVVTGTRLTDTPSGQIETLGLPPGAPAPSRHPVTRLDADLSGTGDLFAALLVVGLGSGLPLGAAIDYAQRQMSRAVGHAVALGRAEVSLSEPGFRKALLAPATAQNQPPAPNDISPQGPRP